MKTRILVVDDEAAVADTLAKVLEKAGYETAVAYDAETALQACEWFRPALVISDVVMGAMNGIEFAMALAARDPACKVILLSGQATTEDLIRDARQRGCSFELIAKPIHPKHLLPRIELALKDPDNSRTFD